jgi:hypothetical protein
MSVVGSFIVGLRPRQRRNAAARDAIVLEYVRKFEDYDLLEFLDLMEVVLIKDPPARVSNTFDQVIDSVISG